MGFLGPMPITILKNKKIPISDILGNILYIMFRMWLSNACDKYVMEAEYLTNFVPNIITIKQLTLHFLLIK